MIIGIGTDITQTKRIKKAMLCKKFLNKYFTQKEIDFFKLRKNKIYEAVASNFAVKEAFAKAVGTGFRGFCMKDIEVLRDELGKPFINLYSNAEKLKESLAINEIFVTISNVSEFAVANVVITKK